MADEQRFDPMKELGKLSKSVGKAVEQGIQTVQTTVQSTVQNANAGQLVRLDVYEVDNEVVIKTNALDGLDPQSIEVSMEGDVLTVKGETKPEEMPPLASYFLQERRYGVFVRNVTIPLPVKSEEARAKLGKNGVLTVTLPVDTARYQDIKVTPAD